MFGSVSLPSYQQICQYKRLKGLAIDYSTKPYPVCINQLSQLLTLNIGCYEAKQIPASVCTLGNLLELYLYFNRVRAVPNELANLQKLEYLECSLPKLKHFPLVITRLPQVFSLYLYTKGRLKLPPEMAKMKKLKKIELRFDLYNEDNIAVLCQLKQLESIRLDLMGGTNFKKIPPDKLACVSFLKKLYVKVNYDYRYRKGMKKLHKLLPNTQIIYSRY